MPRAPPGRGRTSGPAEGPPLNYSSTFHELADNPRRLERLSTLPITMLRAAFGGSGAGDQSAATADVPTTRISASGDRRLKSNLKPSREEDSQNPSRTPPKTLALIDQTARAHIYTY